MTEIERLRAELEVVNNIRVRYQSDIRLTEIRDDLYEKIAKIEAAADPWMEAKKSIDHWRSCGMWPDITGLYDHLTAENAKLEKRVAELEAEDAADASDAENALLRAEFIPFEDMQPPFEGPIESIEPILDPARVLRTAIVIIDCAFAWRSQTSKPQETIDFLRRRVEESVKPYRLKGTDE